MEQLFGTPRLATLLPRVSEFVAQELVPLEKEHHQRSWSDTFRLLDEKRELVKRAGLWGLHLPKNEGGLGLTLCEFGQISEALAHTPFYGHYTFNCQAPDIGNMELLSRFASDQIKKRFLHPLCEGTIRSCFGMTEPEFAGSNPTRLATTATQVGDEYVLDGHKWFTTGAEGSAFCIVMAVTNSDAAPHARASMIVVPTDTPGFRLIRNIPVFGEAGSGWASHAEIRFEQCRVPMANRIGAEGDGFRLAQERLGPGRIHHCMRWVGIAEKAFDLMCQRAVSRELAEGVFLGHKQFIQSFITQSRVEIDAARLLVLRTAQKIDTQGAAATRDDISGIKYYVANMMLAVVDRAIQIFGAAGLSDQTLLATIYQHERGARIWDGADEVHLQSMATGILKKYGLPRSTADHKTSGS
jgi:alkylation response protein AidB-like acyl-CoA dehydrogenase